MRQYEEKIFLLAFGLILFLPRAENVYAVAYVMAGVSLSALGSWWENEKTQAILVILYGLAAFGFPPLLYFLPLISYDLWGRRQALVLLLTLLPLVFHASAFGSPLFFQIAVLLALAWWLSRQTRRHELLRREAVSLRDTSVEQTRQLENQNRELLETQDREVHLATLSERHRIAREIHDHVGHLLTRALLQIGALKAIVREEGPVREQLQTLDTTLTESMNSIRHSLHDLHDEAIDLESRLRMLATDFEACPIQLDLDLQNTPQKTCTVAFLAIIREALANIARHSGAQQAWITLREHPAFYQLLIRDDGVGRTLSASQGEGIGLQNMVDRVQALGGQINFRSDSGFEIFISVPKQPQSRTAGSA